MNEAFINGFVKRAVDYGLPYSHAISLLKSAAGLNTSPSAVANPLNPVMNNLGKVFGESPAPMLQSTTGSPSFRAPVTLPSTPATYNPPTPQPASSTPVDFNPISKAVSRLTAVEKPTKG